MKALTTRSLAILALAATAVAMPVAAHAATRSLSRPLSSHVESARATSAICDKVSGATVSKIIGYSLPNATSLVVSTKATAATLGVASVTTLCTYGAYTSMASIERIVSLSYETLSKALSVSQMEGLVNKSTAKAKFTFQPLSGLGAPAFYYIDTESGITGQGIDVEADSLHYVNASVETKTVSKATLSALATLAKKL